MGSEKSNDSTGKQSKHRKRNKKRSSSSNSDSSVSIDAELKEKLLKKLKKLKKKEKKRGKKKKLKEREEKIKSLKKYQVKKTIVDDLEKSKKFAPMTKEEWEKQQNTLNRVYDAETGRTRLIRGSGEIVEECVSRERQRAINKQATLKDGEYFQKVLSTNLK